MGIRLALAGNPNCGKTTLFNALTGSKQHVGNWPGVTVEKKEGTLKGHKDVTITDLPGVYSLSPYSPEERIARDYIVNERPDAVVVILDATNLERNLYFATQVLDLGRPVVLALNMMDVVNKRGDRINVEELSRLLGVPVCPISAIKGEGLDALTLVALGAAKNSRLPSPAKAFLPPALPDDPDEAEAEEISARYDYVGEIVSACVQKKPVALSASDKIDRIVTHRVLALPIFAVVMFLVYYISVTTVGDLVTVFTNDTFFGEWIGPSVEGFLVGIGCADWLTGLVVDGIIGGVGAVIGFVPQMLILFFLLCILEDCGYMARVAFIMDRIFRRFGLSGKSFIPMLIGSGCGVPGVMASRTIEQTRDRRMTIMTTTFIPCGAKMPIVALIAGAIFGGVWWVAPSAYFVGIAAVIVSGVILKKTKPFAGEPAPFVMELPPYHGPTAGNVLRGTWERGWSFIKRAGTIILLASIAVWFLSSFGMTDGSFGMVEDIDESILAVVGSAVAVIFRPLGFGSWQATVATVLGLIAKEEVVGVFGVLFGVSGDALELVEEEAFGDLAPIAAYFTTLSAYSFLIFNLLCAPCFAAIGAIRREMNSAKWTWFAIGYQTVFAYTMALLVYQFGLVFSGAGFGFGTVFAIVILIAYLYLLFRKGYQPKNNRLQRPAGKESVPV